MSIEITINVRMDATDLAKVMEHLLTGVQSAANAAQTMAPVISKPTMPNMPAASVTAITPPVPVVATNGHKPVRPQKKVDAPKPVSRRPAEVLPFDEFDELVRKEVKRLGMDGRLPNHLLWNDQRDKRLPTLAAVMLRYKCSNLEELATELGVEPPLRSKGRVKIAMPYNHGSRVEQEQ